MNRVARKRAVFAAIAASLLAACGDDDGPASDEQSAVTAVKAYITEQIHELEAGAEAMQVAAPTADEDGWNCAADKPECDAMRAAWKTARASYERIEGAIAVLFADLDVALDARYDAFLADGADDNLFDGRGVTGMHAVERILYADQPRVQVVDFEKNLPGYKAAAFPSNANEAAAFKTSENGLLPRLVSDVKAMHEEFEPLALDAAAAFRGVIGSMGEQVEKADFAASGEDESRYANNTLADMRANLEGGREVYEAFRAWLKTKPDGAALDAQIVAGFDRVEARYDALTATYGDSLPPVPDTWMKDNPSEIDAQSDYGALYLLLRHESDETADDSLVATMLRAADALGIPQLPE